MNPGSFLNNWTRLCNCQECGRVLRGAAEIELCAPCLDRAISETMDGVRVFTAAQVS